MHDQNNEVNSSNKIKDNCIYDVHKKPINILYIKYPRFILGTCIFPYETNHMLVHFLISLTFAIRV